MNRVLTPSSRRNHERRSGPTVQELISQVSLVFGNAGVAMEHSRISRLVRGFKHQVEPNGHEFVDYIVNSLALTVMRRRYVADELLKVVAYSDPTGEQATDHVMKNQHILGRESNAQQDPLHPPARSPR